jgi:hypothetical protein
MFAGLAPDRSGNGAGPFEQTPVARALRNSATNDRRGDAEDHGDHAAPVIAAQRPEPEREKIPGDAAQLRCHEALQDKQRILLGGHGG